jgi:hypothetical protein
MAFCNAHVPVSTSGTAHDPLTAAPGREGSALVPRDFVRIYLLWPTRADTLLLL